MGVTLQDDCEVLIIGGGLTGLTAAVLLHEAGHSVIVVEAAARLGGRVHSLRDRVSNAYLADLGPTWIWPEAQPFATRWMQELDLELTPQFDKGDSIIDLTIDASPARQQLPGMDGSAKFKLSKWPQIEREFPKHFRIATAMMKGFAPLTEVADASGATLGEVVDFVNAYAAIGFVQQETGNFNFDRKSVLDRLRQRSA